MHRRPSSVASQPMASCMVATEVVRGWQCAWKVVSHVCKPLTRQVVMSGEVWRSWSFFWNLPRPSWKAFQQHSDGHLQICRAVSMGDPQRGQESLSQKSHRCIIFPTAHWPLACFVTHRRKSGDDCAMASPIALWFTVVKASASSFPLLWRWTHILWPKTLCRMS